MNALLYLSVFCSRAVFNPSSDRPGFFRVLMRKLALFLALLLVDALAGRALSDDWGCSEASPCFIRVIDGDTIKIRHTSYRLCGIDVPELGTQVGEEARVFLHREIYRRVFKEGQNLTCLPVGHGTPCDGRSETTSYNRKVAQCFVGQDDIAEIMVERGYARDVPRYSGGYYRTEL